ncbi:MAG: hypothetical protein JRD89_01275 [Deltaproteobacteria bacterium]|nr:hypothetical protein [Deltaproteobacteria bacterium]
MMSVVFWEFDRSGRVPVPITEVAEDLGVDPWDIHRLFEKWREAECPESYRMKVEEKRWLRVFVIRDDVRGWVSLVRPWGRGWRNLSNRHWFFTLEVAVG